MPKGTIKRLFPEHGFGFIKTEYGDDLFFYRTALEGADYRIDFNSLREGQQVEFIIGKGSDGRRRAVSVRVTQLKTD